MTIIPEGWVLAYEAWLRTPQAASATDVGPGDIGQDWFERSCANSFKAGYEAAILASASPAPGGGGEVPTDSEIIEAYLKVGIEPGQLYGKARLLAVARLLCRMCRGAEPLTPSPSLADKGLVEEARAVLPKLTGTLPVCPFDSRSPDYWTTPDDKPCHVCGGTEAMDKCRGADLRCLDEAADVITRLANALEARAARALSGPHEAAAPLEARG